MKKITASALARKFQTGEWEAMSDATRFGRQDVRNNVTNRFFTVEIVGAVDCTNDVRRAYTALIDPVSLAAAAAYKADRCF